MAKFKIEESKENSIYTVLVKKAWYTPWRIAKKKNGQAASFTTKQGARLYVNLATKELNS
jgi:hypothetical protein